MSGVREWAAVDVVGREREKSGDRNGASTGQEGDYSTAWECGTSFFAFDVLLV